MYKLLLISDKPEVRDIYASLDLWAEMDFRTPRIAASAEEGMESLSRHYADAVAVEVSEAERDRLYPLLNTRYPALPVMTAGNSPEEVQRNLRELKHLLDRLNADYSNDRYDPAEKMQLRRHAYFRKLLQGEGGDEAKVRRELRLLRSRMDPDRACVVLRLDAPSREGYISEHWHYGQDRLEVAMRNIFGAEYEGMRVLVSVMPDERLFLVACPMKGATTPKADNLTELVTAHTQSSIEHVREYLGLELRVGAAKVLPSITHLGEINL